MYDALQIALEANQPVLITGAPGVGKTAVMRALARQRGWPIETIIASICEPSDLGGLPVIDNGGVRRVPPRWATNLAEQCKDGKPGIMFFDELSTAAPANQAVVLRISQERVVGDLELPESVRFASAANPVELSAGGWDLSAPLANRLCHLTWQNNPEIWVKGMRTGFPDPPILPIDPKWRDKIPETQSLVASFIKAQPHKLLVTPSDDSKKGQAWPSNRTWHYGAILLACGASQSKATQIELLSGMVGDGPAGEFFAWLSKMDLPDPKAVLENPKKHIKEPKADEEHRTYAIVSAALALVEADVSQQKWNKAWTLLAHIGQWSPDVAVGFVSDMARMRNQDGKGKGWMPPKEVAPFMKKMGKAMEVLVK